MPASAPGRWSAADRGEEEITNKAHEERGGGRGRGIKSEMELEEKEDLGTWDGMRSFGRNNYG